MIPDPVFEQNLINKQIDNDGINGQVLTSRISSITQLGLTSLNGGFSLITNLQGIEGFVALEKLELSGNDGGITSITINNNLNLKELYFYGNYIINLVVSAPLLETLAVENPSPLLQSLDITNCPALKNLFCYANSLTSLNISNNPELEILDLSYNLLTQINISNKPQLRIFSCWNNLITSLDLTNCPLLTNLYVGNNNLTSLNVSQNNLLKILSCSNNNLTFLNVTQNIVLKSLACAINNITSLNLQNNPDLELVLCQNNNLVQINAQNGSNNLLNGTFVNGQNTIPRFNATNNPNLRCILVDDVANCQANWTYIDPVSNFVASQSACDNLLSNKLFSANKFKVYPNPTTKTVNIDFGQNLDTATITLTNFLGQVVANKTINNLDKTSLDINEASGIYFLEIVNDKLEKQVFKILKD